MRTLTFRLSRRHLVAFATATALALGGAALIPAAAGAAPPPVSTAAAPTAAATDAPSVAVCPPTVCVADPNTPPPPLRDGYGIAVTWAAPGQTLTVAPPLTAPPIDPATVGVEWLRDGLVIDGVGSVTAYTVTLGDVGHEIAAAIWWASPDGSPTGRVTNPVTIVETVSTIRLGDGIGCPAVMPPAGETWDYVWYRDGVIVPDAVQCGYMITTADENHQIWLVKTITRADGTSSVTTSVWTVPAWASDFVLAPLFGQPVVGGWLSLDLTNSLICGSTYNTDATYTWLRDGDPIDGATEMGYVPTAADLGHDVALQVLCLLPGSDVVLMQTTPAVSVTPGTLTLSDLTVTGAAKVGQTLTARFTPQAGATYTYQWLRDGQPVAGQTTAVYGVTDQDQGHNVAVQVSGTAPGYNAVTATSPPVLVWDFQALLRPIIDMLEKWLAQMLAIFPMLGQ